MTSTTAGAVEEWRRRGDPLTYLDGDLRDDAVERRADHQLLELDLDRRDLRLRSIHLGSGRIARGARALVGTLELIQQVGGDDRLFGELAFPPQLPPGAVARDAGLAAGGFGDLQAPFGEAKLGALRRIVQAEQRSAGRHPVSLAMRDLHDPTADLRRELRPPSGADRSRLGVGDRRLDPAALHANHLDGDALGSEKREPEQNRGARSQEKRP